MRQLATVQRITKLSPIENADQIEFAHVLGWKAIVRKGDYKEGDTVVYFEIDSILPEGAAWVKEHAQFMEKTKWRVKTYKVRGVVGQGLVMPVSILYDVEELIDKSIVVEGGDLTEKLGVTKFDLEAELAKRQGGKNMNPAGNFPTHIVPKTDEMRIQSKPELLDEMRGMQVYVTTKIDGTSATFISHNGEFMVCSRNLMLKEDDNVYWRMVGKYSLRGKMLAYGNIAVQAEIAGPGFGQPTNPLELYEHDMFVFNVYDIDSQKYFGKLGIETFCRAANLKTVPMGDTFLINGKTIEDFERMAVGKYEGTNSYREGIVVRPTIPAYSHILKGMLSFKVVSKEFLLKQNSVKAAKKEKKRKQKRQNTVTSVEP